MRKPKRPPRQPQRRKPIRSRRALRRRRKLQAKAAAAAKRRALWWTRPPAPRALESMAQLMAWQQQAVTKAFLLPPELLRNHWTLRQLANPEKGRPMAASYSTQPML